MAMMCGKCKSKYLYWDYFPGMGRSLACPICGNREGSRYGFLFENQEIKTPVPVILGGVLQNQTMTKHRSSKRRALQG